MFGSVGTDLPTHPEEQKDHDLLPPAGLTNLPVDPANANDTTRIRVGLSPTFRFVHNRNTLKLHPDTTANVLGSCRAYARKSSTSYYPTS